MRYKKVGCIVRLLFVFFKRSVLNFGIMKSKLFRYILIAGIAAMTIIMSILLYNMFSSSNMTRDLTNAIVDVYSVTTFMWTFVIFMFMKILFMKKDSFIRFTTQMPVSKVEKNVAIVIFEIVISLIIVNLIALSAVIAFVAYAGPQILLRILCNVFFTCSNGYLILELTNRLASYVVGIFELNKMKETILICLFMGVFFLMYSLGVPMLTDGILFNYMDNQGTSVIALFSYIMDNTHFIVSAYLFLALVLVLIAVICFIPDELLYKTKQFMRSKYGIENNSFIKKRLEKNKLFASYFVNISRRIDTLNYSLIIIFSYLLSLVVKMNNPEYVVALYAINGIYVCVQTASIRNIMYQKEYDVIKDYIYMILSQIMYMYIVAIPFTIISLIRGNSLKSTALLYLIMFIVTVFSTFIGIVFVPKKENPISVMIGLTTTIIFALIMYLCMVLLQLQIIVQIIIITLCICVVVYYSLLGLVSLKNETVK